MAWQIRITPCTDSKDGKETALTTREALSSSFAVFASWGLDPIVLSNNVFCQCHGSFCLSVNDCRREMGRWLSMCLLGLTLVMFIVELSGLLKKWEFPAPKHRYFLHFYTVGGEGQGLICWPSGKAHITTNHITRPCMNLGKRGQARRLLGGVALAGQGIEI